MTYAEHASVCGHTQNLYNQVCSCTVPHGYTHVQLMLFCTNKG